MSSARDAYPAGVSLRSLARVTGLGWARLRREIDAAGVSLETVRGIEEYRIDGRGTETFYEPMHSCQVRSGRTA